MWIEYKCWCLENSPNIFWNLGTASNTVQEPALLTNPGPRTPDACYHLDCWRECGWHREGPQNFPLLNDYGVAGKCSIYHKHIERKLFFWERDWSRVWHRHKHATVFKVYTNKDLLYSAENRLTFCNNLNRKRIWKKVDMSICITGSLCCTREADTRWLTNYTCVLVAQSCPPLCDPMGYSPPGILQTRILEWVAILFSRGSSQPRDWTQVSHVAGWFFTLWATREVPLINYTLI